MGFKDIGLKLVFFKEQILRKYYSIDINTFFKKILITMHSF